MNLLLDLQILGWLLVGLGLLQGIPVLGALVSGEPLLPYVASAGIALLYGLPIALSIRPLERRMHVRDGFVVTVFAWLLASIFGALPYVLSGALSPVDAFFESVAGFTTTGSTTLTRIEGLPHALLLWRSLTQWLGGMGIIVFTIAVVPLLGIGGMQLFRAEVPGPVKDKLTPRIAVTAQRLWLIYFGLTGLAFVALLVTGMGLFDALCHALTTLATGGFSTRDASIAAFGPGAQWVIVVFMALAGTNFALHYRVLAGRLLDVARDVELHLYLIFIALGSGTIVWLLSEAGVTEQTLRIAFFQVVSILTTTGFATDDYELWPAAGQFLIFHLLLVGGMAGSTAGGIKTLRFVLGINALRTFVWRLTHPHAMRGVRYAGRSVSEDVVSGVAVFFLAYLLIAGIAGFIVAMHGYDLVTSMSAAFTAIGNVGPGLGGVGPTDNFAHFPALVKLVLAFCMIAGRLEVFTVLVILEPHFWRR
ncbi:MAG TPA: TrkH family potassium uptake protein [Myxococcota bacterium]